MAGDFPPILRINYIPDIESTGAKEGFLKLVRGTKGDDAKYNNKARITFAAPDIIVLSNGEPRAIPYKDYKKNPENYPEIRIGKFGITGLVRVKDFDHGHEMTFFFNAPADNPRMLNWFADAVLREMDKHEISDDNKDEFVFEIGKTSAAKGSMGKYYIKYLGLSEDLQLMSDPTGTASAARKESLLEKQTPPPAAAEIQGFVLNTDEKWLMEQINELIATKKVVVTTDRLQATFEKGMSGKKTTPQRAAYIATHAKELGYNGEIGS